MALNCKSIINNHLSFMMSYMFRPLKLYTEVYKYSKFCCRCARVELKYNIIHKN